MELVGVRWVVIDISIECHHVPFHSIYIYTCMYIYIYLFADAFTILWLASFLGESKITIETGLSEVAKILMVSERGPIS